MRIALILLWAAVLAGSWLGVAAPVRGEQTAAQGASLETGGRPPAQKSERQGNRAGAEERLIEEELSFEAADPLFDGLPILPGESGGAVVYQLRGAVVFSTGWHDFEYREGSLIAGAVQNGARSTSGIQSVAGSNGSERMDINDGLVLANSLIQHSALVLNGQPGEGPVGLNLYASQFTGVNIIAGSQGLSAGSGQ